MTATTIFLNHATPARQQLVADWLSDPSWEGRRDRFLNVIDQYAKDEIALGPDHLVQFHEAGGNWRILFSHLKLRPNDEVANQLNKVMAARQAYVDACYYQGYPDESEVHHDVETFLYFQIPLYYSGGPGRDAALRSICRVADHCCNWSKGVPQWYNWQEHGFVSTWLGTRSVRNRPPFDYQEANHFRFIDLCTTAYVGTKDSRYLALAIDYADRWCDHIKSHNCGGPIPCQILPPGATSEELGHAGGATRNDVYQIFYAIMASNTAYDVAMALMDLYTLTGVDRYLDSFRMLLDPFFAHARDGRPPLHFAKDRWEYAPLGMVDELASSIIQSNAFPLRMALKHDMLLNTERYREPVLAWASVIDEEINSADQSSCDVMVAAYHYTRDTAYLARAYAMALRTWAVCEENMGAHDGNGTNCRVTTRYGSKFIMELLYLPMLNACDWGTRGNLPSDLKIAKANVSI